MVGALFATVKNISLLALGSAQQCDSTIYLQIGTCYRADTDSRASAHCARYYSCR
jgi:hypothetical protein